MTKSYDCIEWDFFQDLFSNLGLVPIGFSLSCNVFPWLSCSKWLLCEIFFFPAMIFVRRSLIPYLFILMADTLSSMLHWGVMHGVFKGVKLARQALFISHLCFANDSLLFIKAYVQKCHWLYHYLSLYFEATN